MERDGKKAAKAFVDNYFPVRQPNTNTNTNTSTRDRFPDVLSDLFPPTIPNPNPNPHQEYSKKPEKGSSSSQSSSAGSSSQSRGRGGGGGGGSRSGSHSGPSKGNAVVFCEVVEPCNLSSSVDYGSRDNYYPNNSGSNSQGNRQAPAGSYNDKERKDGGYEYPDPEHSRGEWWQGSLYY